VAKTPTGLAYDAATDRLFVACREKPLLVVIDARSGKVLTSLPIGQGVDWAYFDPDAKQVLTSNGEGTLSIFQQTSPDSYESLESLKTQSGAKTMAVDPRTKKIFLPAAEFVTTPASDPSKRPQRSVKPGSFVVLVVGHD
jgi:DNA-binding beta-propeller fold protein YncE